VQNLKVAGVNPKASINETYDLERDGNCQAGDGDDDTQVTCIQVKSPSKAMNRNNAAGKNQLLMTSSVEVELKHEEEPKISHLTPEEFNSIPTYMKGAYEIS